VVLQLEERHAVVHVLRVLGLGGIVLRLGRLSEAHARPERDQEDEKPEAQVATPMAPRGVPPFPRAHAASPAYSNPSASGAEAQCRDPAETAQGIGSPSQKSHS